MSRNFRMKWLRYAISVLVIFMMITSYNIKVEGESTNPRFVLMRLEDIGPGGQYGSMEQLGKLRAVMEYLRDQHVAYHLAVIPRWLDFPADGSRYDVSLDQADNPYVAAYQTLLRQAVNDGAVLGMHGYTHQVGLVRRDDGHHESGIGNEFNETDEDYTRSASFAEPRLKAGLDILSRAGLKPQFWESPHYRSTPQQDAVFRSYFGLNYQADVQANRNASSAQYLNQRNASYGEPNMGAAYIPTPYDYIPYNKDEKFILDRLGRTNNINSFFYHPFLEFKYLIPVLDEEGEQVVRDGLPEFRYPDQNRSVLQKLIAGLKEKRYVFYSIQDYVPFTPSHSLKLKDAAAAEQQGPKGQQAQPQPSWQTKWMFGDITGDGQADAVSWDLKSGSITVAAGAFGGLRNEPQGAPSVWGNLSYAPGAAAALGSAKGADSASLWVAQPNGVLERFIPDGGRFQLANHWQLEAKSWANLQVLPQAGGDVVVTGLSADRMQVNGYCISKGEAKPLKPYKLKSEWKYELQPHAMEDGSKALFLTKPSTIGGLELSFDKASLSWKAKRMQLNVPDEDGDMRLGDFNGDGQEDVLRYHPESSRYTVYLRKGANEFQLLSTFGPWGKPGMKLIITDFDGNGKSDLGLYDRQDGFLDTALSFEHQ
ncbi:DUF2334 domain-containing protein [Paenibacillus sp. H1-7]|uniref:DUF2334 domain-containing protein n=1 Tax=Paenibacillus sp. H1-7 TaxID=2282849 RepID=UPI001EF95C8D|nr:DUF2334 domain-containing protein [Paenibacillus sp. H1-7]ULL14244.1 DUF2334 domain-containing protein [Paenibacillus sp. H1-7]